jgi:hypothetical protein
MSARGELKKLLEQPGVSDLEREAVLDPRLATESSFDDAKVQRASRKAFGFRADETPNALLEALSQGREDLDYEEDFEPIWSEMEDTLAVDDYQLVALFNGLGWDVTDERGRPLLVLGHFKYPLYLVANNIVPLRAQPVSNEDWEAALKQAAAKFHR